jgi:hypothetical protein
MRTFGGSDEDNWRAAPGQTGPLGPSHGGWVATACPRLPFGTRLAQASSSWYFCGTKYFLPGSGATDLASSVLLQGVV